MEQPVHARVDHVINDEEIQPKMKMATSTTVVVACTSLREGVVTLRISVRTSL